MSEFQFNKFYRYEELTSGLNGLVEKFPNLTKLISIGKSFEGRDIWRGKRGARIRSC